jgi:putative copper resistance protein D
MGDLLTIIVRVGLYVALVPLFGIQDFVLAGVRLEDRRTVAAWVPIAAIVLGLVALVLFALQLVALAASMGGTALSTVDAATLSMLLASGGMAMAWKIRVAVLAAGNVSGVAFQRYIDRLAIALSVTGAIALGSLAWFGHGAADRHRGWIHLGADLLHLLAAWLWASALATFCAPLARPPPPFFDRTHLALCERALACFAGAGTLIVATLTVTGVANGVFLIGWRGLTEMILNTYGLLPIAKLIAFAAMLALAASNQFRLTPALLAAIEGDTDRASAFRRLQRSVLFEAALLVAILALVGWFGTLQPPMAS